MDIWMGLVVNCLYCLLLESLYTYSSVTPAVQNCCALLRDHGITTYPTQTSSPPSLGLLWCVCFGTLFERRGGLLGRVRGDSCGIFCSLEILSD